LLCSWTESSKSPLIFFELSVACSSLSFCNSFGSAQGRELALACTFFLLDRVA
jgi:hypothetical protein